MEIIMKDNTVAPPMRQQRIVNNATVENGQGIDFCEEDEVPQSNANELPSNQSLPLNQSPSNQSDEEGQSHAAPQQAGRNNDDNYTPVQQSPLESAESPRLKDVPSINCKNYKPTKSSSKRPPFITRIYHEYNWIIPLYIGIFVSYCLVSQITRPYDAIIERRSRPFHQRVVFEELPSFPTFSIKDFIRNREKIVNYPDDDSTISRRRNMSRDLEYYGDEEGEEGEEQEDVEQENEQQEQDENENEADEDQDDNNKNANDDKNQDDDNDDGDEDENHDEDENYQQYYNATNETSAYYDDYEVIVDDFFRYIDDNVEVRTVFPLEVSDCAGFICASLSIILSIGGGIGPGSILAAVFIIIMDFQPKVAIPMNCITLLGVTILSTFMNMRRRHPLSDRPLIDWDLVLIMEPLTLMGAIAGTYINKILGQKVLIVLLVLLLSLIAHNTLKKARKMHHAEELYIKRMLWAKQKRRNNQAPILATLPTVKSFDGKLAEADPPFIPKVHPSTDIAKNPNKEPLLQKNESVSKTDSSSIPSDNSHSGYSSYSSSFQSFIVLHKADAESVKSSIIEEESDPIPQNKITYIFTMFLGVIAFNLFKGGASFESPLGIICGSAAFWFVEFLTTVWLGCCTFLAARYLLKRHAIKEAVGFDYVRGDIKWDVRTIVIYPTACVFAGLVSGMFGIGCGVLIAPMLVGIGVNPLVASATCSCMNFFTSLTAASSYVVLGSLSLYHQYAVVFFFIGIISMFIGRWVMSFSVHSTKIKKNKRLERHSYMAYSMGLVVLVSALCMTVEALLDVVNHSYEDDEVDGICDQQMY